MLVYIHFSSFYFCRFGCNLMSLIVACEPFAYTRVWVDCIACRRNPKLSRRTFSRLLKMPFVIRESRSRNEKINKAGFIDVSRTIEGRLIDCPKKAKTRKNLKDFYLLKSRWCLGLKICISSVLPSTALSGVSYFSFITRKHILMPERNPNSFMNTTHTASKPHAASNDCFETNSKLSPKNLLTWCPHNSCFSSPYPAYLTS